ncbi:hypothetical protein KIL84_004407 [Mauremys mutica]|uniref:Uncharacterized protein n=1 Tax=Mauremys mutica TaxID=74926 RepID=A0A9D3XPM9_9SAUR|nr:hypothetical protein KIL84_004407 [Mauremys mutica]
MSTYELYKASETCTVCLSLFNNFHVFPAQEGLRLQIPAKKTYCSKKPQTKTPPKSLKLWQQVRYSLFLILIKQRLENNYNVNFLFFKYFELLAWRRRLELGRKGREWN